jgi:hypothetical protein
VSGPRPLDPGEELFLPLNKRIVAQYAGAAGAARELHLYCGDKEIVFDEPDLFAFGETLARQSRFAADDCTRWGEGYGWPRVRDLLQHLLDEGVLQRSSAAEPQGPPPAKDQPSPLPPAPSAAARTWDECAAITHELTGRALEPGYLELVVPVFRVAHIALDAEGRQVGEANVFPRPLRVDVPTRWRTCIYPGSRYLDDKPMNVSALKAMRSHWPQVMASLMRIRQAYFRRFPAARGGLTLGDIERLSTLVLAVPTYQLVRAQHRVANGALHPVLSAMFRVTDGLRMTTHQMLFVPVAEATLSPDTMLTAGEIHAYAERNASFHSAQGVCAGPSLMIDQFLRVLVEGADTGNFAAVTLDPAVEQALADLDQAFDYGLYGLQAFAAMFSLWPLMTRTYARIAAIVGAWKGEPTPALERLDRSLRAKLAILQNETFHATEAWRANREQVYADIHAKCAAGLGDPVRQPLFERLAGRSTPAHQAVTEQLRGLLRRRCCARPDDAGDAAGGVDLLVECLMHCFVRTQETLCLASEIQGRINTLVGRPEPTRLFSAADSDIHVLLQGDEARKLPHLLDELEQLLGFRAEITREGVVLDEAIEA